MALPQKTPPLGDVIENVIIRGDLSGLTTEQRVQYYNKVCDSVGLNPLTQPFDYMTLQGKLKLYAKRDAADQLRKLHGINIEVVSQEMHDGLLSVHVRAIDRDGRKDEDLGVVNFPDTMRGEVRANAIMKAVTKAKRRVTLSIAGLGYLDETEMEDIPAEAKKPAPPAPNVLLHDPETGEIPAQGEPVTAQPHVAVADAALPAKDAGGAAPEVDLPLTVEGLARQAAMRGSTVFRTFYRNRSGQEQMLINAIGDELRELMDAADTKED